MRILLTNDDGVLSPVLQRSAEALAARHEVVVAAPAEDQSGKSHAFTHGPDRLLTHRLDAGSPWPLYRIDGTPADCVKFAVSHLLKDRPPEIVVSGPNLGENAGISAIYSGTVAAAREAALWGIPGLAVSLNAVGRTPDGRPEWPLEFALDWLLALLDAPDLLPAPGAYWNVNFPAVPPAAVAGARFTRMSTVMFRDSYEEAATAHGIPGHRLQGHKPQELFEEGTDDDALRHGRIAVTPLRVSQCDDAALENLRARADLPDALAFPVPAAIPGAPA